MPKLPQIISRQQPVRTTGLRRVPPSTAAARATEVAGEQILGVSVQMLEKETQLRRQTQTLEIMNEATKELQDFIATQEADEDFEIDILDAPGSPETDVVRTIMSTISAGGSGIDIANVQATYTDADQITDFGSIQSSVSINIYQLSAVVGRGFAGSATLTL